MSNIKRNFSAFQNEHKQSIVSSTAAKKVKQNSEPNIKVYTRFRPVPNENYSDTYQINLLENSITINKPEDIIIKNGGIKKFFFSEVFESETTQEEIMKETCIPLVEDLFNNNKSSLLFTYGVTNAGKTHTIIGTKADPGILPRTIKLLLSKCSQITESLNVSSEVVVPSLDDSSCEIKMENILNLPNHPEYKLADLKVFLESFEIYNEDIYDLLLDNKKDKISGGIIRPKLQMKEKDKGRVYIKDLTTVELTSASQVENILDKCVSNRSQADTLLNSNSSRSHTIFRIVVKYTYQSSANKCGCETSLCIVDLAGSERAKRTENAGNQMVEACNINKSLLVLGRCLKSLKENQNSAATNSVVPYRDSKLTRILYEYFHEENNLRMIANINPRQVDFEESMRVLNYAAIAKDIQPIKSRIDNTRRILFPLGKDLNKSRTEDNLSNLSAEDSLLNFKGLFDDKENFSGNLNSRDSLSKKHIMLPPVTVPPSTIDDRDIKIRVLEDMVMKLQEKLYLKDVTSKLNNINDSFKQSMRSFITSEKNSLSKALDSFAIEPLNAGRDCAPPNVPNSFADFQNIFANETKPMNVNYFIFQGPIEEKGLNGLQRIFNVSNSHVHRQICNNNMVPEMVRTETKETTCIESTIVEKPEPILIEDVRLKEEEVADDESCIIEETKSKKVVNKGRKPPKKNIRAKKNKKGAKTDTSCTSELAELTGFEHLDTPELIRLTEQLDEEPHEVIMPKEEVSSLTNFEVIEVDDENCVQTPIARRTRARKQRK